MQFQDVTFQLAVVALPGLIWALMDLHIAAKTKPSDVQFAIRIFLFGLIAYAVTFLGYSAFGYPFSVSLKPASDDPISLSPGLVIQILTATVVGCSLGTIWIYASTYKLMYRFLRWIRATKKYGDEDLWDFTFNSKDKRVTYVNVRDFANSFTYSGFVNAYSETGKLRELVLRDAQVFNFEGHLLFEVPILYLAREPAGMHVEFPAEFTEAKVEER